MVAERRIRTDTILLTAGLLLVVYLLGDVLLLVFAAVLIAVGLDGLARAAARRLPVSRGWALGGVTLGIVALLAGVLGLSATQLVQQLIGVSETVIAFVERLHGALIELGALQAVGEIDNESIAGAAGGMAEEVMIWGMAAFGALAGLAIVFVLTIFLSASPALYRAGAVRLVPPAGRIMAEETLSAIAHALRWWFLGQLVSMALLGATVGLGRLTLGVELWLGLAVLTALLTLVPFIGPLVATVPIVAVGFSEGVQTGLIVLAGYLVIQAIEGNFVTPMIQKKAVNLAPALLIAVQVFLSLVFGIVGLILAAPLTIVGMVAVEKLWMEHTLQEAAT